MKKNSMLVGVIFIVAIVLVITLTMIHNEGNILTDTAFLEHFNFRRAFVNCSDPAGGGEVLNFVEEPVGNLPRVYVQERAKFPKEYNKTCAKFPQLFEIKYLGDYWQVQDSTTSTLHLYNAYLDDRRDSRVVRVVSLYDRYDYRGSFYCQFWYDGDSRPVVEKSEQVTWIWIQGWGGNRSGAYHPYLISCPLKAKAEIPVSVSVVERQCDNATNNLRLSNRATDPKSKKDFVVCVKGLNFPYEDKTLRLVEWIELLFLLGADKINFYEFTLHPNVRSLLNYYVKQGNVELTPISLAGGVSNTPYLQRRFLKTMVLQRRLQEVIPYNDCFYKHQQQYRFVVLLDIDEVIVPLSGSWADLMKTIQRDDATSYMARNVYFLDNYRHSHEWFEGIPRFLHMLQHVYRSTNYTKPGAYVKGFHDTKKTLVLHNHFPLKCLGNCRASPIDTDLAHLQHYRTDCVQDVKDCDFMRNNYVIDARLWRYKDELIPRVLQVLTTLGVANVTEV